jgi:hypothetical protein
MTISFRELPRREWPRLVQDGIEPFASSGLPDNEHWRMLVCEQDGRIVGASILYDTVHNDWYIAPSARRNPAIVTGLWRETEKVLTAAGLSIVHTTVLDAQPEVQMMVERLGYLPAGGKLYLLHVPDCVLNER